MDQKQTPKRMEIYMTNLPHIGGSIQYGYRPVLVIQNDVGNTNSSTTIVVALTSKPKRWLPTHVTISPACSGLPKKSVALCEQIITMPQSALENKVGEIKDEGCIQKIYDALRISIGI